MCDGLFVCGDCVHKNTYIYRICVTIRIYNYVLKCNIATIVHCALSVSYTRFFQLCFKH